MEPEEIFIGILRIALVGFSFAFFPKSIIQIKKYWKSHENKRLHFWLLVLWISIISGLFFIKTIGAGQ